MIYAIVFLVIVCAAGARWGHQMREEHRQTVRSREKGACDMLADATAYTLSYDVLIARALSDDYRDLGLDDEASRIDGLIERTEARVRREAANHDLRIAESFQRECV